MTMPHERVVLAYDGGLVTSAAIPWLVETGQYEVVTVTLDIGQGSDLAELRDRALACGAVRAHAIDARDDFARDVLLPSLYREAERPQSAIAALPRPFIARKLVEIARLEGARVVAHGAFDTALDEEIHALDPSSLRVVAPARTWGLSADDVLVYARQRALPVPVLRNGYQIDRHLWGRTLTWNGDQEPPRLTRQLAEAALVDIHFEQGVPTAINGVPMAPAELIECLSLIAEQHGIGRLDAADETSGAVRVLVDAPAAIVLQAAAHAAGGPATADVSLKLDDGQFTVLSTAERSVPVNVA